MGKKYTEINGSILNDLIALGYVDAFGNVVSNGNDYIWSGLGNDIVHAAGGHDRIWAGDGDDTVYGGEGSDRLYGEDGNDVLLGGLGKDRLFGGRGDDFLDGGEGNDQLRGDKGNDTLMGGEGNDKLWGKKGNNVLDGGDGDDYLDSGDNASTLNGGADDDDLFIRLAKGADHVVTGGSGADEFIFNQSYRVDESNVTITDFELGIDSFKIDGVDHGLYMTLIGESAVTDVGGNALLTLTTGDTILFEGISETDFENHFGI